MTYYCILRMLCRNYFGLNLRNLLRAGDATIDVLNYYFTYIWNWIQRQVRLELRYFWIYITDRLQKRRWFFISLFIMRLLRHFSIDLMNLIIFLLCDNYFKGAPIIILLKLIQLFLQKSTKTKIIYVPIFCPLLFVLYRFDWRLHKFYIYLTIEKTIMIKSYTNVKNHWSFCEHSAIMINHCNNEKNNLRDFVRHAYTHVISIFYH